jgi:hypothetical protein
MLAAVRAGTGIVREIITYLNRAITAGRIAGLIDILRR